MRQKTAIITGAAGGLGAAVAALFRRNGYQLILTDVLPGTEEAGAVFLQGDLSDRAFLESLVPTAIRHFGTIDSVVNIAAWRELKTMRTITPGSWSKTIELCLTAPAFLARAAANEMESRGAGGVIVNVSSIMSQRASGIAPAYVAAKAGLEAVTRDLAVLYGRSGIRVVGIAPGAFEGPTGQDYGPNEIDVR
ncbi:MAG TPA: SDR family oxidoreductase, partial [Tepidisphaeraceae bacterium]|nr:SDR family oxidoreductase [Tepidisphaeraceae bacterium]